MNTQQHFLRIGLLITLASLAGCGANAESAITTTPEKVASNQPISVRSPLAAPQGWVVQGSAKPASRLTTYRGQTITELAPIKVTRTTL